METGHSSKLPIILAIVFGLLFVFSLVFGFWAFAGKTDVEKNLEAKIEVASAQAVKEAEAAKDEEFAEIQKDPYRTYTGSSTYGSLSFDFPKNWSVYTEESDRGTILDFYAHPNLIPGTGDEIAFGLRAQILDDSYDEALANYDRDIESGTVSASAYRLDKVPSELGTLLEGEVQSEKQGVMVMLPLRDKTILVWTESDDYFKDFEKIIKTISFIP